MAHLKGLWYAVAEGKRNGQEKFQELNLSQEILKGVTDMGLKKPLQSVGDNPFDDERR